MVVKLDQGFSGQGNSLLDLSSLNQNTIKVLLKLLLSVVNSHIAKHIASSIEYDFFYTKWNVALVSGENK